MDIVEFLTARLDEEALAAREASIFYDDHDAWENGVAWRGNEGENANGFMNFWLVPHLGVIYDPASGRHIVRHNPARVLAEVKAKRVLLASCSPLVTGPDALLRNGQLVYLAVQAMYTMAAPYADHPDYNPAWRVEQ